MKGITVRSVFFPLFSSLFTPLFAQNDSFVLSSGEVKIHYKTFGEGVPVLILNGGPGMSCEGFIALAQKIAAEKILEIL